MYVSRPRSPDRDYVADFGGTLFGKHYLRSVVHLYVQLCILYQLVMSELR